MRRHAPLTTAFVSLLVLVSYATAAFVDCERPTDDLVREVAHRSAAAARPASHGAHETSSHAARSVSREPQSASADGVRGHAHAPTSEVGAGAHAAHATRGHAPAAQGPAPSAASEVVIVPTCSCGCSETRALVGGSLARLGATIPAVYVAALPAAVVVDGRPSAGRFPSSPFVDDDPVPI